MRLIHKYAIWLVIGALVGLAGAWVAAARQPAAYASSASVDVEPRIITGSTPITPNLVTEEKVATSGAVLDKVAPVLGMSPSDLSTHLDASVASTSSILTITCTMPLPAQAQHCATVVTQAYIDFRNQTAAKASDQARDPLEVSPVSPALLPTSPAGTAKPVLLAIGALLGLLLGVGGGYVRDRADDRVRDRADLSLHLGAPALVEIPPTKRKAGSAALTYALTPESQVAEAYRYLRIRIDALSPARDARGYAVLVTGPRGGEGSTSVASNLAMALAQAGDKVLLVDGDVRNSSLSSLYRMAGKPGLTDLLTGLPSLIGVSRATGLPRVTLVPAGQPRGNPAELLEPGELARVIALLLAAADVVVIDSGPVLGVSDPIALASVSDVVVVVADVRSTTRADVRAVAHEIGSSGKRHVVGVLNRVPRRRASTSPPPAFPAPQEESLPQRERREPATQNVFLLPQVADVDPKQTVIVDNDVKATRPDTRKPEAGM